ncbi:hypothetical protein DFP72DRAFT_848253 [Ephemerocybe angulata]|uniref:Uncharacterized protein n=1 Tax=Ephemerocybe angulata TaxID=980116 RepID=A0A8H6M656_9AGAR|nr:hypothetical protein DFP72DRAFT_848253 [Tulosesus angulatus]
MSSYLYDSSSSKVQLAPTGITEFEILKARHKTARKAQRLTWDDQLARKYYDSLYREFAVCDLKHYKSGNTKSWTERGRRHAATPAASTTMVPRGTDEVPDLPPLTTLELPFAYSEQGENKSALKLMWKRTKEKEKQAAKALASERSGKEDGGVPDNGGEERREGSGSRGHSRREASRRGSYEAEITGNTSSSSQAEKAFSVEVASTHQRIFRGER